MSLLEQLELFPTQEETSYRCYSFENLSPEQKQQISSKFKVGDSVSFFFGKEHISKIKTIWYVFGYKFKQFAHAQYSIEGFNRIFHEDELTRIN